jgi:hypothetical protein
MEYWDRPMLSDSWLVGTWKLHAFVHEALPSGERTDEFGDNPTGYLTYTRDGRMHAILMRRDRPKPRALIPTKAELAKLHATMVAYAGTFTVEKDEVVHHIDVSWNQTWNGTDQRRFWKLEGDVLTLTTAAGRDPIDGKEGRFIAIWNRLTKE